MCNAGQGVNMRQVTPSHLAIHLFQRSFEYSGLEYEDCWCLMPGQEELPHGVLWCPRCTLNMLMIVSSPWGDD